MPQLIIGLMSGTSLDGLDIALLEWPGVELAGFEVRDTETYDYPSELRREILQSISGMTADVCRINFRLGHLWAEYVNEFLESRSLPPDVVTCIGSHGQTLWHESGKATLQVGEPAVLAAKTGIPVVSNFRENDIAAGGTGAPLIPFLDWLRFRQLPGNTVALNIGGIANITCLSEGMAANEVVGWDTGPGNMVMDTLIRHITNGRVTPDIDGRSFYSAYAT
ncbi:MAG: anhydro-N-acetylmuramic acid kinase [Calditrichota bacterium]